MIDNQANVDDALSGLKPFQRRSAHYVFDRLYGADPTRRFLLADEVGLGKTVVAKGVIAMAVNHLADRPGPINVVYICSNQDLARQNIVRLCGTGTGKVNHATRITLLPTLDLDGIENRVRFVSFTPGTSFDLKSNLGRSDERVLLYHLLREHWEFRGSAPLNVLQGDSGGESFRSQVESFSEQVDSTMKTAFLHTLAGKPNLRESFEQCCGNYRRTDSKVDLDGRIQRSTLVGDLRAALARSCLESLKPDLVILDEFQRFKHLLSEDDESDATQLARDLFNYSDANSHARVLMLSATPYKMYTSGHESEDDHYADFLLTAKFLLNDTDRTDRLRTLIELYGKQLHRLDEAESAVKLMQVRDELAGTLRRVMCRTERLAVTTDRGGMLKEIPSTPDLRPGDLRSYLALQKIARGVEQPDTIEYWKSSPFLLSFMDGYQLKEEVRRQSADMDVAKVVEAASLVAGAILPWEQMRSFASIDAHHPRLRQLIDDVLNTGAWEALWVPPCIPYYSLSGSMKIMAETSFTKRLIFSCWKVVPKAIATLTSYEADRRVMVRYEPGIENTPDARKGVRPLLNFTRSQGRLAGMPVLGLLYPSSFLAREFDPLRYMCDQPPGLRLDAADVVGLIQMRLESALQPLLRNSPADGNVDESWYWAAAILLDRQYDPETSTTWWEDAELATNWASGGYEHSADSEDDESSGWDRHVASARDVFAGTQALGRPPDDLAEVLAQIAIAGPAVTALRAIARVSGGLNQTTDTARRFAAGKVAFGVRSLFNAPDVIAMVRGQNRSEPYWRRVLEYCLDGCFQAVLDEYAHVLRDGLGGQADETELVSTISQSLTTALQLRVANLSFDRVSVHEDRVKIEQGRLRAAFALRYGDETDEAGNVSRASSVQTAFNSPFRPFVLATTSVGQEGLDFHPYCHAVVHWNLPSNPVDLEQREGRVHRYKGHAVRKNVARAHAASLSEDGCDDPWTRLFEIATEQSTDSSGLSPFWVYPLKDGAFIERHIPSLPLSREESQLPALRNALAVYRMVFGQPRQDDLVEFLSRRLGPQVAAAKLDLVRIDLTPPEWAD